MKMFLKKNAKTCVAIILMLAVIITGATAYLATSDKKENVFTVGFIDIELIETGWVQNNNSNNPNEYIPVSNGESAILPGTEIPKAPYVKNTGNAPAWIFMTIGIPTVQSETTTDMSITLNAEKLYIPVKAYGIQEGYEDNTLSSDIWSSYFDAETIFGTQITDASNRVELFDIYTDDIVDTLGYGWTLISTTPYSVEGYNYYTYVYDLPLQPQNATSELFEKVKYIDNIKDIELSYFTTDSTSTAMFFKDTTTGKYYLCGLEPLLTEENLLNKYFESKNVTVTTQPYSTTYYGTGSTVTVNHSNGKTEEYTIVIYGDINGDGQINASDRSALSKYVSLSTGDFSDAQLKACDVNHDGIINNSDVELITGYTDGTMDIVQVPVEITT